MKIFGRHPMKKLEQTAADLRVRAERLAAKRTAAQAELDRAIAARQSYAIEGDLEDGAAADRAISKLQSGVDAAASTLAGFDSAITTITAQVAEAERALLDERQSVARTAASEKLAREIAVIEAQVGPWLYSTRSLAANLQKLSIVRFDPGALGNFVLNAANEAELAFAVTIGDLHGAVAAIAEGREPIPAEPVMIEPAPAMPAPPPTVRLFLMRDVCWTEEDHVRIGRRYSDCDLPAERARRALKSGAAVPMEDPKRKALRGQIGASQAPRIPTASECESLDPPVPSGVVEPTLHSAFEPLDRGKPYIVRAPKEKAAS
jgi:hypothetical protein